MNRLEFLPAVDLLRGCAVRLRQGRRDDVTVYSDAPWDVAASWAEGGADRIHVVDLDAAFDGFSSNGDAVRRIVASSGRPVELGGGIRSLDDASRAIEEWGVHRVILGTVLVRDPAVAEDCLARFGAERVVAGIDARGGVVKVAGWTEGEGLNAHDLGRACRALGIRTAIFTEISRDGMLQGPDIDATVRFASSTGLDTIVSGGIADLDDLRTIREAGFPGIIGVIVGKALFDGRFDAIQAASALHGQPQ